MTATESFKAGRLQEAIDTQLKEVKAAPADHAKRLFLFELLAFAGDLEKARRQIDVIKYDDLELEAALLAYRKLLDSEQARRQLFSDGVAPRFFGDQPPPEHVRLRLEAVRWLREQRPEEAARVLAEAQNLAPASRGELNGKPFDSLRDCDDVFGTVLEVLGQGHYYWVPLEQVETLAMSPPRFPRDLLWMPARLELRESRGNVFLPALYPGSHQHADNQIKLGQVTDWTGAAGEPVRGHGLRTFLVGDDAVSLREWRQLQMA